MLDSGRFERQNLGLGDVLDKGEGGSKARGFLPHIQRQGPSVWREQRSRSCFRGVENGDVEWEFSSLRCL